jgi:RNA polymerase sigma-70 factor (ECF subfamily)
MAHDNDMLRAPVIALHPKAASGDAELVERALEEAVWAKAELFKRHAPSLTGLMVRLLGSTADAEDAVQDAFVQAFRDLPRLREHDGFAGWLRAIAVHQAHRRFRRRKLLRVLGLDRGDEDASLAQLADLGASPEMRAELGKLDAVLRRMPAAERIAWMLRHVEGCELLEVADACGCSLATVKRRIAAAEARVARHVEVDHA